MKYKDYLASYVGKAVKIDKDYDTGIYTISPASVDPTRPYWRDDILQVHDDFVVVKKDTGGGAPGVPAGYDQEAIPMNLVKFKL